MKYIIYSFVVLGTTLNLLKFPLERPLAWKLHRRSRRLREETSLAAESAVHRSQAALKDKWDRFVLTGEPSSLMSILYRHMNRFRFVNLFPICAFSVTSFLKL